MRRDALLIAKARNGETDRAVADRFGSHIPLERIIAMSFQITGLDAAPFRRFYGLSDEELQSFGVKRLIADEQGPVFPIASSSGTSSRARRCCSQLPPPAGRHALQSEPCDFRPRMGRDAISSPGRNSGRAVYPPDFAARLRPSGDMVDADLTAEATLSPRSSGCSPIRRPPTFTHITPSAAAMRRGSIVCETEEQHRCAPRRVT